MIDNRFPSIDTYIKNSKILVNEMQKFSVSTEECGQSIKEFSATYDAIQKRYHPIIWALMNLFAR